ncbi:hypothetical protein ETR37_18445, partial [Geobacillus sp. PK12]
RTARSLRKYLRDYPVDAFSMLKGMRKAMELIGYPPTSTSVFTVEAIAEGVSAIESFKGVGRAFEECPPGPRPLTSICQW